MTPYTGRGDEGLTDLADTTRVPKTDPRIEAAGAIDELNGLLGTVRPTGHDDLDHRLLSVQQHLHVAQSEVATPGADANAPAMTGEHVASLEEWIDEAEAEVEPLEQFIVPGGGEAGAALHHARSVCRRAERRVVEAADETSIGETTVVYLNRLSDALFVFARVANHREGIDERPVEY